MVVVSFVSRPTLLLVNRSSFLLRERGECLYPCHVWRTKAKRDSPETMPIVAEYAKSNRSSCKSCSKTIAAKTLRLGLISKGPGGFDMTRWHHFDCFPTDSESIVSVHDIEGFSALQKDDQDILAKFVEQRGEPAKELDEKEEEIKIRALDEISEPDVKEKTASSKIIAEYAKSSRSSCKKCSQPIASKQLRLGLVTKDSRGFDMTKWHHSGCFPVDSPIDNVEDIGGFSSLQKDDQDTLSKFVEQCGEPAKELDEKVEGIKNPALDEISKPKVKETTASSKVIAEYAKSSRSSCKKCSQPIASKQLRLGLVTRDSRGFDMTKWHHLGCFPVDSDPIATVEDIGGFSSLQNDDQDVLKGLMQQCEKNTFVDNMDDNNADSGTDNPLTEDTNKRKHSQVGELVEEESQTNANKQTTKKPKMNISESTSQVEVTEEISLSASDVKAKYRDASLLPRWKAFETVIFLERDDGLNDSEKIAAFDFDGCLAKTSVKTVGADAWSLMYPSIPEKLQSLYSQGYKLVIFTNESNIDRWKNKRQAAVDSKIGRLNSFIKRVEVPIQVFIACGVASSGGKDDLYRKPKAGMWQLMKKHFNSGIAIDMNKSFYVGDAAGRKGDHSDADIKFAQASGLKFYTPEEYFIS